MSSFRIAAAALLALSAAAAPAFALSAGEAAAPDSRFASGIAVTQGQPGAGRPGHSASSATGNPFGHGIAVSRSQENGLENSLAVANNASAQDSSRGNAALGGTRMAAR
ncbi:hypothetical protein [Pseudoroseomonas cervicalis]|uniref:hypothetical protein n=1 Tax=Teichococcus cervicalis TaxID=204525 RepID=UPI002781389A|nr:hypothetical protein [Pseudoroseomonas cervicalis]MDQ1081065.1 hypothetical protein [Pseudoroseomonas cervicalis]